jgi:hypothetical protein
MQIIKNISNKFNSNIEKFLFCTAIALAFIESARSNEGTFFANNLINYYKYKNFYNPFFETIKNAEFTLQIFFPYFLLKLGLNYNIVNLIINIIIINISLFSIFYLSQIFTKKKITAFNIAIILIFFGLINSRWYGIKYPISFFYFGQLGMYLFLLTISLFFLNKKLLSYHFLIISFFCHAAWGLLALIFILLFNIFEKNNFKKPKFKNLITFLICLLITFFSFTDLKKKNLNYEKSTSTLTSFYGKFQEGSSKELNKFNTTHKVKLFIEDKPLKTFFNFARFYLFDVIFIIAFLIVLKNNHNAEKKFFIVCFFIWTSIHIYNFFDEKIIEYLSSINVLYGGIIDRIIPTRFLNFINILVTIYCLNILLDNNRRFIIFFKYFFIITSIIFLIIFQDLKITTIYLNNMNFDILSIFFLLIYFLIFFSQQPSENFNRNNKINNNFFLLLFAFFFLNTVTLAYKSLKNYSENKKLFSNEINIQKTLLYGGNVYGNIDANHHINIPLLIMINPQFPFYNKAIYNNIFCNNTGAVFEDQHEYFNYLNDCFSARKNIDWLSFEKLLNIGYVLVPSNVKIDLPILTNTKKFTLYEVKKN